MSIFTMRYCSLPIDLAFSPREGKVAFVQPHGFRPCFDQPERGVEAAFRGDNIIIGGDVVLEYGVFYEYKTIPKLLDYLAQQNLSNPYKDK